MYGLRDYVFFYQKKSDKISYVCMDCEIIGKSHLLEEVHNRFIRRTVSWIVLESVHSIIIWYDIFKPLAMLSVDVMVVY